MQKSNVTRSRRTMSLKAWRERPKSLETTLSTQCLSLIQTPATTDNLYSRRKRRIIANEVSDLQSLHDEINLDPVKTNHLAYLIWEHDGRPEGRELEHWYQAEMYLLADKAIEVGLLH